MTDDDLLHALLTVEDGEPLWDCAVRWLAGHGFDRVIHMAAGADGVVSARTTLGRAFETTYRDEGLDRADPFAAHCLSAPGPVATGAAYVDEYDYLSAPELEVIHAAAEAGFRAGVSAVVRRDRSGWEAWNLGSSLGRREVEAIRRAHGSRLHLGLSALRGRLAPPARHGLTARERQCLDLLARGLRTKAIAGELGLSTVTVEFHLRNARGKLGTATRDQTLMRYLAAPS